MSGLGSQNSEFRILDSEAWIPNSGLRCQSPCWTHNSEFWTRGQKSEFWIRSSGFCARPWIQSSEFWIQNVEF